MHTQTFGYRRSTGLLPNIVNAIAGAFAPVWTVLSAMGQSRARAELLRLADQHAHTRPELAAQLRAAAARNWYGEA
jgi:hypothetical protein